MSTFNLILSYSNTKINGVQEMFSPPPSPWTPSASQARHLPHTWKATLPSQPSKPTKPHEQKSLPRTRGRGTALAVEEVHGLAGSHQTRSHSTTKRRTPAHGEGSSRRLTEEVLSLMRCEVKEVKVDIYLFGRYNKSMIVSFRDKDRKNISIRFSKETEDYH